MWLEAQWTCVSNARILTSLRECVYGSLLRRCVRLYVIFILSVSIQFISAKDNTHIFHASKLY